MSYFDGSKSQHEYNEIIISGTASIDQEPTTSMWSTAHVVRRMDAMGLET